MAEEGRQVIYNMVKVGKTLPSGKTILKDIYLGFYYGAKIGIRGRQPLEEHPAGKGAELRHVSFN